MTTFGEIIEPSSRAFWEDYDNEELAEEDSGTKNLYWQVPPIISEDIDMFILADGKEICQYLSCQLQHLNSPVNSIDLGKNKLELYKLAMKRTMICFSPCDDVLKSSEIVELLNPYVDNSKQVVTFQCQPLTGYQTKYCPHETNITRYVATEELNVKPPSNVKPLEQPNFVSGVSAGLLTHRQYQEKGGITYICYIDSPIVDSINMKKVNKVFEMLKIELKKEYLPKYKAESNLYL